MDLNSLPTLIHDREIPSDTQQSHGQVWRANRCGLKISKKSEPLSMICVNLELYSNMFGYIPTSPYDRLFSIREVFH